MPHLLLGFYVLAFSLGVVVVLFSAAGYRRLRVLSYKSFSLQFAGLVLILLGEGIRTYDQVTGGAFSCRQSRSSWPAWAGRAMPSSAGRFPFLP